MPNQTVTRAFGATAGSKGLQAGPNTRSALLNGEKRNNGDEIRQARCAHLRAPGAFGAGGTSDPHVILSRAARSTRYITRVCLHMLAEAPAPPAPPPLFSAWKSLAALLRAMRVCSLPEALRTAAAPLAAPPAPLSAAFGRTQCGAPESGFIGRRQRLCRALYPQRTRASESNEASKEGCSGFFCSKWSYPGQIGLQVFKLNR